MKKLIWQINLVKYSSNKNVVFTHREARIEDYFKDSKYLVSISDSRALNNGIKNGIKTILFDYTSFFLKAVQNGKNSTHCDLHNPKNKNLFFMTSKVNELLKNYLDYY